MTRVTLPARIKSLLALRNPDPLPSPGAALDRIFAKGRKDISIRSRLGLAAGTTNGILGRSGRNGVSAQSEDIESPMDGGERSWLVIAVRPPNLIFLPHLHAMTISIRQRRC